MRAPTICALTPRETTTSGRVAAQASARRWPAQVEAAAHADRRDGNAAASQLPEEGALAREAEHARLDAALAQRRHERRPVALGAARAHVGTDEEQPHA